MRHEKLIYTPRGLMSQVHLEEAPVRNGRRFDKSCNLILSAEGEKEIRKVLAEFFEESKDDFGNEITLDKLNLPLKDGNISQPKDPHYKDKHFLVARVKKGIEVTVDKKNNPIPLSDIYSGCTCRLKVRFYFYSVNGNNGVTCELIGIQKIADGERITISYR